MSARTSASHIVDFPLVADEKFLSSTVDILERLRAESELRGHNLLASLLAITKGEAEDDLKTRARTLRLLARDQDHRDDGVARMAQKLACRGGKLARKGRA